MFIETKHSVFLVFRYIVKSKENKIKDRTGQALQEEGENAIMFGFHQEPDIANMFDDAELNLSTTIHDDKYEYEVEYIKESQVGLTEENIRKAHKFFLERLDYPIQARRHLYFDLKESEITEEHKKIVTETKKSETRGLVDF